MAKETCAQSLPSSPMGHVQEDGSLTKRNPDRADDRTLRLLNGANEMHHRTPAIPWSRPGDRATLKLVNPATVLKELFELLEDDAPIWYTEENHNRAVAALAQIRR